ncbi:MAG: hypothetical protein R3190_16250, partial [Thermoanaerobaculia bacterium]|nr:hypothetical protein [Thermoanaerobaculia bacterium]
MRPDPSPARRRIAAVAAVAATYTYFLIWAQFGFVHLLRSRLGETARLDGAMAAMGIGGLAASLALGALLRRRSRRHALAVGFAACVVTACLAPVASAAPSFVALGLGVGVATAAITVTLASRLASWVGLRSLGLSIGVGTGIAYLVCNVPAIFDGGPGRQALAGAVAGLVGLAASPFLDRGSSRRPGAPGPPGAANLVGASFAAVVLALLVLVWLDSAAFNVIQESARLRAATWAGGGRTIAIGVVHLVAAVVAGRLLDRGHLASLLGATFALFFVAFRALAGGAA